jgi:hypothetical protein
MTTLADTVTERGRLTFTPWDTATVAFDADSDDCLLMMTPLLGPSSTVLLHHVSRRLRHQPELDIAAADLAHACGLGHHPTRNGLLVRSLNRLEHFGYLRHHCSGRCEIRTKIPPLSHRHIAQLPEYLRVLAVID